MQRGRRIEEATREEDKAGNLKRVRDGRSNRKRGLLSEKRDDGSNEENASCMQQKARTMQATRQQEAKAVRATAMGEGSASMDAKQDRAD
jgi:pyruvoyl-dependent arginine decarboxylase (PvlArgDC)